MKLTLKLSLLVFGCAALNVGASEGAIAVAEGASTATEKIVEAVSNAAPELQKPTEALAEVAVATVTPELQKPVEATLSRLASMRASLSTMAAGASQRTIAFVNKVYSKLPARLQAAAEKTYSIVGQHKKAVAIAAGVAATVIVAGIIYKKMQQNNKQERQAC